MKNFRRGFLYLMGASLFLFGMTALFAPHLINEQLQLMPTSIAGTSETRGLYGGGFIGFAMVIICGLRCRDSASGLLMAMAIIMGCIVAGRLISIGIDHELASTVPAVIGEVLIALACWLESKNSATTPIRSA